MTEITDELITRYMRGEQFAPALVGKIRRHMQTNERPNYCVRIARHDVPPIPDHTVAKGGVIDSGPHRWRLRGSELVSYIEYQPDDVWAFPWKRLWTAGDDPEYPKMQPGDIGEG